MSLSQGTQLGAYQIVEAIGRGGMATVYKAYQPGLARYVAIKVLPAFFADEEGFRERFQREAIAVASLRHPNILRIFDYGEDRGVAYIVTELVEGGPLSQELGQPLPVDQVCDLLAPIAAALDYAHARGLVHRDVKPSNILVAADRTPILADFGLAQIMGSMPRLTRTGTLAGTPEYMAPEYAAGEPTGPATDQYALAVVAYEMLTGQVPFSAETPLAVLLAHLYRPLPMPRSVNPALRTSIEMALLKGLAKSPQDRYPSAAAFMEALAAGTAADTGVASTRDTPTAVAEPVRVPPAQQKPRRWIPAALAVIVVGALVAAGLGVAVMAAAAGRATLSPPASTPVASTDSPPILADTLASPSLGLFPQDQSGDGKVLLGDGTSSVFHWDVGYAYSALVAHVIGSYPANPDGAWLVASTNLERPLPRDFAVQVRARATRSVDVSAYGLGYGPGPYQQYQFDVMPGDQSYRLVIAQGQPPAGARSNWITSQSHINLLRLEVRGDTLRILDNGHELARVAPPGLAARSDGTVSLRWAMTGPAAERDSVEVRFDQFAVYALP